MQGGGVLPLSPVQLFGTPWTAACQASLSFSICLGLLNSCLLSQWCYLTWSTVEGNGKSLQYSCLQNPMNSMKGQKCKVSESRRTGDGKQKFAGESSGSPLWGKEGDGNWGRNWAGMQWRARGLAGPVQPLPIGHRCTQGRGVALGGGSHWRELGGPGPTSRTESTTKH